MENAIKQELLLILFLYNCEIKKKTQNHFIKHIDGY